LEIREAPDSGCWAGRGGSRRSARVVLDELVEGLRLRVRVLQHPEEVLEEDDLAADHGAAGLGGAAGAVDEGLEQRVAHELLGDEVPAARLADVDRVQALGHLVRGAVERRAPGVAAVVAVLAGRRRPGDAAGRVPPPDHAPQLPQPALRHCLRLLRRRHATAAKAHQAHAQFKNERERETEAEVLERVLMIGRREGNAGEATAAGRLYNREGSRRREEWGRGDGMSAGGGRQPLPLSRHQSSSGQLAVPGALCPEQPAWPGLVACTTPSRLLPSCPAPSGIPWAQAPGSSRENEKCGPVPLPPGNQPKFVTQDFRSIGRCSFFFYRVAWVSGCEHYTLP
jgi:hypothetical protein